MSYSSYARIVLVLQLCKVRPQYTTNVAGTGRCNGRRTKYRARYDDTNYRTIRYVLVYNNQRHMTSYPTFRIRSASAVGGVAARSCVAFSLRCQSVDIDAVVTRVKYS